MSDTKTPLTAGDAHPSRPFGSTKKGAAAGGWVCFGLGVLIMYASLWAFILYIPLFTAAFVLSVLSITQRRVVLGVALLLATIILPGMLLLSRLSNWTTHSSIPHIGSSLEDEARTQVAADFARHWTPCGDSWFTHQRRPSFVYSYAQQFDYIDQHGVQFVVSSGSLSEAQRMNGMEWHGQVNVIGKLFRLHFPSGIQQLPMNKEPPSPGWSQWFDGVASLPSYVLTKVRGQWNMDEPLRDSQFEPIDCKNVPKD